eukprot:TRINITY_DN26148_c0_g1_i1.p1 TRINITY_DN26148_c0_g1~~TRINITY_DN26148_c0_g1_i1.p1  ORF type:complete len:210 (-),score=37.89 TRINITY_DN26148_c0_g1_i1:335-964(-)
MSFVSGEAAPATVGSYAVVLSSQRRGRILAHDPDDEELAYKLAFEDGASPHFDWFPATAVMPETSTAAAWGPEGTSRTTAIAAAVSLSCEIPASKDGPPPRQLPEALSPRLSAQTERRWPSLEEDLAALGSRSEDWHRRRVKIVRPGHRQPVQQLSGAVPQKPIGIDEASCIFDAPELAEEFWGSTDTVDTVDLWGQPAVTKQRRAMWI